jgi:2,3-bisphosphoglycerate-independent phosphoglycerate mutase
MSHTAPKRDDRFAPRRGPLIIAVMDGIGQGRGDGGDAVHLAEPANLLKLWGTAPTRQLRAHGVAVGLPSDADMGNSEVGHNALGAGRVVRQGAALVNDALGSGALFRGDTWRWLLDSLPPDGTLHLCGLLSDGNVHADMAHILALVDRAAVENVAKLRIHALADGRDVEDPSFERYLEVLDGRLEVHRRPGRDFQIASGGGRMVVTMDRYEADWSIVERGWQAHVQGAAERFPNWRTAVATLRKRPGGGSDQTIGAFCIGDETGPVGPVRDGDAFVLWNFRGDRAIELTRALEQGADFSGFDRGVVPDVRYAGMMQYDGDLHLPRRYLVAPPQIRDTMSEFVIRAGLRTLAVSETQKFGHVTYFWNGNRSGRLDDQLETWLEIPSDNVPFDTTPAMKARQITDAVIASLTSSAPPEIVRLNYANGDMVGHTGNLAATIEAVRAVDKEIGRLMKLVQQTQGTLLVTADHGNADDMWMRSKSGAPKLLPNGVVQAKTSHTLAPVPLTIYDRRAGANWSLRADLPSAGLANVAATCFSLLGLRPPEGYDPSLVSPRT